MGSLVRVMCDHRRERGGGEFSSKFPRSTPFKALSPINSRIYLSGDRQTLAETDVRPTANPTYLYLPQNDVH